MIKNLLSATRTLLAFCFFALVGHSAIGSPETIQQNHQIDSKQIESQIDTLARQVNTINRDQLNYKIEKELLKEAYSTSLQSVNLVITIVLGVFSIIGFLGIRSIRDIRHEYSTELDKIRSIKGDLEEDLRLLRIKQKESEEKVTQLTDENIKQDRRLKILEIIEKVASLTSARNYLLAFEHISVGLSIDSDNILLLTFKAMCCGKLGRTAEGIETIERLLVLEPNNSSHIKNLLELYALSGNSVGFEKLYNSSQAFIDEANDGGLTIYLRALLTAIVGNFGEAMEILEPYIAAQPPEPTKRLGTWSFDDILKIVSSLAESPRKRFLLGFVKYFQGELDGPACVSELRNTASTLMAQ